MSKVPYQFFVIKEKELIELLSNETNANRLPFRTLVERRNEKENEILFWNKEKYGKKYILISAFNLGDSADEIIETFFKQWLARWGLNNDKKAELLVHSEGPLAGWVNAAKDFTVFDLKYGFGLEKRITEFSTNYPKVFYDHHGGGLGTKTLEPEKSFLSENSYIAFGKNSKDYPIINNSKPINNWILPYNLMEAGLSNLLIIDERILDISARECSNKTLNERLTPVGKFWYGKYTENFKKANNENQKIHNIDAFWASNIIVATHLNTNPIKAGLFNKNDDHFVKLVISKKGVELETNFDFLPNSNSKVDDYTQSKMKQFDAVIMHRTFLNKESISTYWRGLREPEDILGLLSNYFPAVYITSGGGDVLTYKGHYKFVSFNELLQCLMNPETIGKTTLINNLFSKTAFSKNQFKK